MNNLMMFDGQFEVAILLKEDVKFDFVGDFIISAKDVANVLEYQGETATNNVLKFCKDQHIYLVKNSDLLNRDVRKVNNAGEKFISNLSLNRVLGKSGQHKAEIFQDWLYEDVLPSVQKHGIYATENVLDQIIGDPQFGIQVLTKLKEEKEARKIMELQMMEQKPLVVFAEMCLQSTDSIKVRELAHKLSSHGIKIGQNRLYDKMRSWGLIFQNSREPKQTAVEQGLFEVVGGVKQKPNGGNLVWNTTYVTVKGQMYVANRLKKEQSLV